ncbi:hypothetical protein M0R72_21130 [Candidatus Pacearchaeota archaeon]|nr:hypothetical protein [Candidatus Pacearchaeota archaeon]
MSKTSKSNPEKGLRTVSIEFGGKTRTLKFTHSAIGDFENAANSILRNSQIIESGKMIFADGIMEGWLGNARIFSLSLMYGLKHESTKDDPITIEIVDAAIDSYIEAGGSKLDLTRAIITAYRYATNPSSVASLKRSWQISDDRMKFNTQAEIEGMERMEKIIADAKAKATPGLPSTDSPESS